MHKKLKIIFCIIGAVFISDANALHIQSIKENGTALFKISEKEYNRIFVDGDAITSVKGKNNLYEVKSFKESEDQGVLYIRPNSYQIHPFSIFVTTQAGRHFTLFLNPVDVPAENIELVPVTASKRVAKRWEENLPYTQKLIELLRDMETHTRPEGYAVINMGKTDPQKTSSGLTMQLATIYRGANLQGEVWNIKNKSGKTLYIDARDFAHANVRAASVMIQALLPSDETILYRIVSHE